MDTKPGLFLLAPVSTRTLLRGNTEQVPAGQCAAGRPGHCLMGEATGWQLAGALI